MAKRQFWDLKTIEVCVNSVDFRRPVTSEEAKKIFMEEVAATHMKDIEIIETIFVETKEVLEVKPVDND